MSPTDAPHRIGLLLSGGLDSCILLGHLLAEGCRVHPFYVRSQLAWQREELRAVRRLLRALACPRLEALKTFDLPLRDLYEDHWSITARGVPDASTPDQAVYLPGRNVLLLLKPAVWCRLHGIERLALGVLGSSPFADATAGFFAAFAAVLQQATGGPVEIVCPLGTMDKRAVMDLGRTLPLELTFSCIAPQRGLHCGRCNKCAERQAAFRAAGLQDPTRYA